MSAPDSLYSAAWGGLNRSLRGMARHQSGTPEHIVATAQATVWLDVLWHLCPQRSPADLLATAMARLTADDVAQIQGLLASL